MCEKYLKVPLHWILVTSKR
jgi:hypothetical protein